MVLSRFVKCIGIYIHIPFCIKRCNYCDFAIQPIGRNENLNKKLSEKYISCLTNEIKTFKSKLSQYSETSLIVDSLYFGGGTPSLLGFEYFNNLFEVLKKEFIFDKNSEITIEADPGTFDIHKLKDYRSLGVNRLSLGIQSFDDEVLKLCGRSHDLKDIYSSLEAVHSSGFSNFNIDLISSLPLMDQAKWEDTLRKGADTGCKHMSIYDLQIEKKTKFGRIYEPGIYPLPSEIQSSELYKQAVRKLTNLGFEHYEISSYAKDRAYRSRHNQKYWTRSPVMAFGLGSSSFFNGKRYTRPRLMRDYEQWVQNFMQTNEFDVEMGIKKGTSNSDTEILDDALETIMLRLRTSDGLDLNEFYFAFGKSHTNKLLNALLPDFSSYLIVWSDGLELPRLDATSLLDNVVSDQKKIIIRLNDPEGYLISNSIISSVFSKF